MLSLSVSPTLQGPLEIKMKHRNLRYSHRKRWGKASKRGLYGVFELLFFSSKDTHRGSNNRAAQRWLRSIFWLWQVLLQGPSIRGFFATRTQFKCSQHGKVVQLARCWNACIKSMNLSWSTQIQKMHMVTFAVFAYSQLLQTTGHSCTSIVVPRTRLAWMYAASCIVNALCSDPFEFVTFEFAQFWWY